MVTETSTPAEALPNERQQNGQRLERTVVAGDGGTARHVGLFGRVLGGLSPALSREPHQANTTKKDPPVLRLQCQLGCTPYANRFKTGDRMERATSHAPHAGALGMVLAVCARPARERAAGFTGGGLAGPH